MTGHPDEGTRPQDPGAPLPHTSEALSGAGGSPTTASWSPRDRPRSWRGPVAVLVALLVVTAVLVLTLG